MSSPLYLYLYDTESIIIASIIDIFSSNTFAMVIT